MALTDKAEIELILAHIRTHQSKVEFNQKIFEILEGDLLKYIDESLRIQLSPDSYNTAMERVAPINILTKIRMKLSKIYVDPPKRTVQDENDINQTLVDDYVSTREVDVDFNDLNEDYNSYKYSAMEIYEDIEDRELKFRSLAPNVFLPMSINKIDPLKITHFIKFMGKMTKKQDLGKDPKVVDKFWVYTNEEFMSVDSDGDIVYQDMEVNGGVNTYGVIPFVITSRSRKLLVPLSDKDMLKMTVLFPVLLTDLNFAVKFLAHSIFYGIDIDADNLKLSPDAVWIFKSDPDGKKPEVGTIRPDVSIPEVLQMIREELVAWLDSKNIKSNSMGKLDSADSISGIAKIIDEADITQDKKIQEKEFRKKEIEFWMKTGIIHNKLAEANRLDDRRIFVKPEDMIVITQYSDQLPIESRESKVKRLKLEVDAGFNSTAKAIKELNQKMTARELQELMIEIDNERSIVTENIKEEDGDTTKEDDKNT